MAKVTSPELRLSVSVSKVDVDVQILLSEDDGSTCLVNVSSRLAINKEVKWLLVGAAWIRNERDGDLDWVDRAFRKRSIATVSLANIDEFHSRSTKDTTPVGVFSIHCGLDQARFGDASGNSVGDLEARCIPDSHSHELRRSLSVPDNKLSELGCKLAQLVTEHCEFWRRFSDLREVGSCRSVGEG